MHMKAHEKISLLREQMKKKGLDAYIIPSSDPHSSEYVAPRWSSRAWISGFTGSAGTLVVTMSESGLWTDGRYFIQAEKELEGSGIKLFKMRQPGVPTYREWLMETLGEGMCVGFDGGVISSLEARSLEKSFQKKGIKISGEHDIIEHIWKDRPCVPSGKVYVHELKYAGESSFQKQEAVRARLRREGAQYYIISTLDDIAWLFNLRGSDVKNNPVFMAYAIISGSDATIFVDRKKLTKEAKESLEKNYVQIKPYDAVGKAIRRFEKKSSVYIDPSKLSFNLSRLIHKSCTKVEKSDIVERLKSVKNKTEIENIRVCQVRDGIAMVRFLHWLDKNVGQMDIDEVSAAQMLESLRREQPGFAEPSFDTICAYMGNAAMMHYSASNESCSRLEPRGFLLLDSGGQYPDGTTDITRTIALGELTKEQKRDFTLVLKGHIALARLIFLHGATGTNLDVIARQPLWKEGIDYKCGTGHGLGYFLSVHEGPQRLSQNPNSTVLEEGMLLTNEPGIYREGEYGIRTENTLLVKKAQHTEFGQFMEFDTISHCPIDLRAIDSSMLDDGERSWLNDYHGRVYKYIAPHVSDEERSWLHEMTRSI
ncbi:Xaa-Pro dipeptidase PepQ [Peptoclostridium acidaminophilum DSM 3953]|uniref:Xaa-Pro dipeptidase PepQ n=2 Tax=Peptoclostridium acidaminophilum TaxID=1731 RepID=W8T5X6_PEPAC|nr:Xaa-Pro dipeptidase PepQ [Peptoclostridium acidaminophilum DSM 3953]